MHKKKKWAIILVITILFFSMIILCSYMLAKYKYDKDIMSQNPNNEVTNTVLSEEKYEMETSITNVLLIGIDSRGDINDARTDSIIIGTVDPDTKKVKLTSLMRDMYVEIPGKSYQKINAAYQYGGIDLLKKTIKYNFNIDVQYYAAIDFKGFQNLIDKLGGIKLEVKNYEVNEINKYIDEVNGNKSTLIKGAGIQELNGQQTLSYCRIRKVGNNDYERTERQRKVLSILVEKLKNVKVSEIPKIYSTLSPYIKTNIPFNDILKLTYTVYKFSNYTPDSMRIPIDNYYKDTSVNGMSVLIPQLKYNALELYKFIYNKEPNNLVVPDNDSVYNIKPVIKETPKEENRVEQNIDNTNNVTNQQPQNNHVVQDNTKKKY